MQQDVEVFVPEMLVEIFPTLTVRKKTFHYNLQVDFLRTEELVKLADLTKKLDIDIFLYRHGKGLTIKVSPGTPATPWIRGKKEGVFTTLGNYIKSY